MSHPASRRSSPLRRIVTAAVALTAAAVTLAACAATGSPATSSSPHKSHYTIGVLSIAQAPVLDDLVHKFEAAAKAGLAPAKVTFSYQNANGDQSLVASLVRDFASSTDDGFAVLGTPAVVAMAQAVKDRPIFAVAMSDPVGAGVAMSLDAPGANVTGSIDYVDPAKLMDVVVKVVPKGHTVGTIYDPSNQNSQVWASALKHNLTTRGLSLAEATISSPADIAAASRSLNGRADILLIGPDATAYAGMDAIGASALASSTPLFVSAGEPTTPGVLASIGPSYPTLGTEAGAIAARVLLGKSAATTPFARPAGTDVVFNSSTVNALKIHIPASLSSSSTVTDKK